MLSTSWSSASSRPRIGWWAPVGLKTYAASIPHVLAPWWQFLGLPFR